MAVEVVIVAVLAAAAALLFASWFPGATAAIVTGRLVLSAVVAIASALILISTNVPALMLVGALIIFLLGLNYSQLDSGTSVW